MAKKVEFILGVDKKPIDVAVDATLNLKQAYREVLKELNKTKEGTKEFELLAKKAGELKDGIEKTSVKSKDLFGSLSMLPGPVGQFASGVDSAISSLKLFTSFSFKDLKFQLGETVDDIKDIVKNLFGLNVAQETNAAVTNQQTAATTQNTVAQNANANSSKQAAAANVAQTATVEAEAAATKGATAATYTFSNALKAIGIGFLLAGLALLITYWDKIVDAVTGATDVTRAYKDAQTEVAKQTGDFQKKLYEVEGALKAAKTGTINKKDALKLYNDKLADTVGYAKDLETAERLLKENTGKVIESIKQRAIAQVFYGKAAEASAKLVSGEGLEPTFWQKTFNLIKAGGNPFVAISNDIETLGENYAEVNDQVTRFTTEGDKAMKTALEIDATLNKPTKPEEKKPTTTKEDPKIQATKDLYKKLGELQDENTVTSIQKERDRQDKELQVAKEREIKEINALQLKDAVIEENGKKMTIKAADVREQMLKQIETKYTNKKTELTTKRNDEDKKKLKDHTRKIEDIEINAIANKEEREKKQREKERDRAIQDLEEDENFIKYSEEKKEQIRQQIRDHYANKEKEIKDEKDKEAKDKEIEKLDDELKFLQIRGEALQEGTRAYYQNQRDILKKAEEKEIADAKKNGEEKKKTEEQIQKDIQDIKKKYAKENADLNLAEVEAYLQTAKQIAAGVGNIISMASEVNQLKMQNELQAAKGNAEETDKIKRKYFEKNKKSSIASAAISTFQAAIDAFLSMAKIPVVGPYLGGLAAAATLYFGNEKIKAIKAQQYESEGGSSPSSFGKNYAEGGMIKGPRHAQGGTMIEAEGGEAIMTRGAVTMFGPLLSMMNQAGGGTSFNKDMLTTANDAPLTTNPSQQQSPMIMKTYVVSNELTTEAEKQARLKDLSTL